MAAREKKKTHTPTTSTWHLIYVAVCTIQCILNLIRRKIEVEEGILGDFFLFVSSLCCWTILQFFRWCSTKLSHQNNLRLREKYFFFFFKNVYALFELFLLPISFEPFALCADDGSSQQINTNAMKNKNSIFHHQIAFDSNPVLPNDEKYLKKNIEAKKKPFQNEITSFL